MKVICIDNRSNSITLSLTIGKVYDVLNSDNYVLYELVNDKNELCGCFKRRFLTLKEYRKEKLERLNNV